MLVSAPGMASDMLCMLSEGLKTLVSLGPDFRPAMLQVTYKYYGLEIVLINLQATTARPLR